MLAFIRRKFPLLLLPALVLALVSFQGCDDDDDEGSVDFSQAPVIAQNGEVAIQVVIPANAEPGLVQAAEDMAEAFSRIADANNTLGVVQGTLQSATANVVVLVDSLRGPSAESDSQAYQITQGNVGDGRVGLRIEAFNDVGGMYGIYHVVKDMGVHYLHPEETFFPKGAFATLPWQYTGEMERPAFELRGYHEHTQHPIPFSDFYLRPGNSEFRGYVSNYIKWLARNRQNAMSFHFLKTVDIPAWVPYMQDIIQEAHGYGIKVGMVTGFADQQQNAFKLIPDLDSDHAPQIQARMDEVLAPGFDFLCLQFGTSEFTSESDATTLGWFDTAIQHARSAYPDVKLYAWIHTFCGHSDEQGGYFFHLPLQADQDVGAWVHTVMYYTLDHPAPVYQCEDFTHQIDFMRRADGTREQVFFPESAWWLGFDNNMPMGHPLTGWSREHDILQILPQHDVSGHITFTTGKEWGYWQYDHYIAQVTWDGETQWEQYLQQIAPVFGPRGRDVADVLTDWSLLAKRHFYDENPEMYFYLSGERPEDEVEIAHPVKPFFREVVEWDQQTFDTWQQQEQMKLTSMRTEYEGLFNNLPPLDTATTPQERKLLLETTLALEMVLLRLDHIRHLYDGALAVRTWREEVQLAQQEGREPDQSLAASSEALAQASLDEAKAVTAVVLAKIAEAEAGYRYPLDILAEEKPESLTAYPIGYLHETRTGYYWTRREQELQAVIDRFFGGGNESWSAAPEIILEAPSTGVLVTNPSNPLLTVILQGFLPEFLFGLEGYNPATSELVTHFAQDYNTNGLPDTGTEVVFNGTVVAGEFTAVGPDFVVSVRDSSGLEVGTLGLQAPFLAMDVTITGNAPTDATSATIAATFAVADLIDIVVNGIGGYDEDGVRGLIKPIWGIPADQPLPDDLPIALLFTLNPQGVTP